MTTVSLLHNSNPADPKHDSSSPFFIEETYTVPAVLPAAAAVSDHLMGVAGRFMAGADLVPAIDPFALPVNRTIERDEEPNLTPADFADCWEGPENDADRRYLISTANLPVTLGDALQRASLACLPYDCIDPMDDNASLLAFTLSKRFPTVRFDVTQFYLSTRGEHDTGAANEIDHTLIESYVAGEEVDCEEGGTK